MIKHLHPNKVRTAAMLWLGLTAAIPAWGATINVDIANFAFSPDMVTIKAGDTVTWTQRDSIAHTSTSDSGEWSSPFLSRGQTFSFKFTKAGSFSYHCSPHPFMTGTVVVEGAANSPPTVSLSSPANGAVFGAPASIPIQVSAADADGAVQKVEIYVDNNVVTTLTSAPFTFTWSNVAAGSYTLYAEASDNLGAKTKSASITISVTKPNEPIKITEVEDKGVAVTISWSGGKPPYLLQKKLSLTDAAWFNVVTIDDTEVTVAKDLGVGFFRVQDQAQVQVLSCTALLSGSAEVPPAATSANGAGSFALEGNKLNYVISYRGLSGPASAAHIHGPANALNSAAPIISFSGPFGSSGVLIGSTTVAADQMNFLKSGQTYVNFHTAANGDGEIRGQIVPLQLHATLTGAAEVPKVTTTARGEATVTLIGQQAFFDIDYENLSSDPTAAHLHGPADASQSAAPIIPLPKPIGKSGSLYSSATLNAQQLIDILGGRTYLNIHTAINGGGEIRGQLLP